MNRKPFDAAAWQLERDALTLEALTDAERSARQARTLFRASLLVIAGLLLALSYAGAMLRNRPAPAPCPAPVMQLDPDTIISGPTPPVQI